jgi:arylsulfatase A-like enzyme
MTKGFPSFVKSITAPLQTVSRAAFAFVAVLSSMYCALAYIPSIYYAFIQASFLGWMPVFAHMQGILFALTFAGVAVSLVNEHRTSAARRLSVEFAISGAAFSAYLMWAKPLERVSDNSLSLLWAIAFLLPIMVIGAIDYQAYLGQLHSSVEQPRCISFRRVIVAAIFVAVLYPGAAFARYLATGRLLQLPPGELIAWGWAAVTHVLLFLAIFSTAELAAHAAGRFRNPRPTRFVIYTVLFWLGSTIVVYRVVLASVPFQSFEAEVYATLLAGAVVLLVGGGLLRRHVLRAATAVTERVAVPAATDRREFAAFMLFLLASAVTVPALIGAMDWNSVLEKTWSLVYWAMVVGVFVFRRPTPSRRWPAWALGLIAFGSIGAYRIGVESAPKWGVFGHAQDFDASEALEWHREFDASFQAARQIMAPSFSRTCNDLCKFIEQQTNIPTSATVQLRDLDLVKGMQPSGRNKPNIFIIVVDSLRQDYVAAYNPDVYFTPAMAAFARDSVVFRNAFTRYGGTALAEPSIWSGTLLLHEQYVQPFHRVNNLEKLVQADGYQSLITVDTLLRRILQPSPDAVHLDEGAKTWTDVDFCSTGAEAITGIDAIGDRRRPVFLYTQAQNVHIITLGKTYLLRPPKNYGKFVDYYSSELERLDGCFGNFMQALKARHMYDNSIIVLTADHGEALQEVGAERHAFSLKPEVIRIPLIIHVPAEVKRKWYYDPEAISFNTDIAATLYELLGHGPVIPRPEYGRPLFTPTRDEMQKYRQDSYMIASSYGPLYGILYENGTKLYLENTHVGVEQFFDIANDPTAKRNLLTEELRRISEAQLQSDMQAIADLFGYKYKAPTILEWLMR